VSGTMPACETNRGEVRHTGDRGKRAAGRAKKKPPLGNKKIPRTERGKKNKNRGKGRRKKTTKKKQEEEKRKKKIDQQGRERNADRK